VDERYIVISSQGQEGWLQNAFKEGTYYDTAASSSGNVWWIGTDGYRRLQLRTTLRVKEK
jgi:hypothetical protein